jgi:hypothetical protein
MLLKTVKSFPNTRPPLFESGIIMGAGLSGLLFIAERCLIGLDGPGALALPGLLITAIICGKLATS